MKSELKPWPDQIVIVGCGGVGSYLIPPLLRSVRNHRNPSRSPEIVLVDGDTLEEKNMDRQLFSESNLGQYKSIALFDASDDYYKGRFSAITSFFSGDEPWLKAGALVFACVDNHPGRVRILDAADRKGCDVIMTGNGYTDAEAQFYTPQWKGTKLDPRVMFPEILTNKEDDPFAAQAGCTGQAQEQTPQLAIANLCAATYGLHLMWYHYQMASDIEQEALDYSPIRHASNFSRITTLKKKDPSNE